MPLTVFDLSELACEQMQDAALPSRAALPRRLLGRDYVISMLPAGKHVATIYLGDDGLLAQLDGTTTILDCSTIDAATARQVGEAAAEMGIGFMDAPVSGGVAAAAAGTLAFMCGGEAGTFEKARLILQDMGKNIFHAGPPGRARWPRVVTTCCWPSI